MEWNEESQRRKGAVEADGGQAGEQLIEEANSRLEQQPQLEEAASEAERELARQLMGAETEERDPAEEAVAKLPPRWEARIQTDRDPIAEETALYRKMAKEVDGRYGGEDEG